MLQERGKNQEARAKILSSQPSWFLKRSVPIAIGIGSIKKPGPLVLTKASVLLTNYFTFKHLYLSLYVFSTHPP